MRCAQQRQGSAHFQRRGGVAGAKIRVRQQRHFRHKAEGRKLIRRELRQFRKLFAVGIEVHVGIDHEDLTAGQNQPGHRAVNGGARLDGRSPDQCSANVARWC